jgi:hypothetical protein
MEPDNKQQPANPDCVTLDTGDRVYYIQYKPGDTIIFNFKEVLDAAQEKHMQDRCSEIMDAKVLIFAGYEITSIGVASKTDTDDDEEETDIPLVGGKVYNKDDGKIK